MLKEAQHFVLFKKKKKKQVNWKYFYYCTQSINCFIQEQFSTDLNNSNTKNKRLKKNREWDAALIFFFFSVQKSHS